MFGQPVGGDQADTVLGHVGSGGREEAGGDEAVHLRDRQPGIRNGPPRRLHRERTKRLVGMTLTGLCA